jgi:LPS-assembly lipoprotein
MASLHKLRTAVLSAALLATAACGYTLRESTPLPTVLSTMAIEAVDLDSPLVTDLRNELEAAGATLKPLNSVGASTLKIQAETVERNVVSLDERAKVGEYELAYRVVYAVDGGDGKPLLRDTRIELSRVYSFDEQQAIGAGQEEEIIRGELRRDAVRMIMERLQRIQDPNKASETRESATAK